MAKKLSWKQYCAAVVLAAKFLGPRDLKSVRGALKKKLKEGGKKKEKESGGDASEVEERIEELEAKLAAREE